VLLVLKHVPVPVPGVLAVDLPILGLRPVCTAVQVVARLLIGIPASSNDAERKKQKSNRKQLVGLVLDWTKTPQAFEALAQRTFRGKAVLSR
jgi:hypothetical protein